MVRHKRAGSATMYSSEDDDVPLAKKRALAKNEKHNNDGKPSSAGKKHVPIMPPPQKRASNRHKSVGRSIKHEGPEESDDPADASDREPTTPSPNKKNSKSSSVSPTKSDGKVTSRDTPRKRAAPVKELAAPRGIPTSWADVDEADRMLVTFKENGADWLTIRKEWQKMTGQITGAR